MQPQKQNQLPPIERHNIMSKTRNEDLVLDFEKADAALKAALEKLKERKQKTIGMYLSCRREQLIEGLANGLSIADLQAVFEADGKTVSRTWLKEQVALLRNSAAKYVAKSRVNKAQPAPEPALASIASNPEVPPKATPDSEANPAKL